MEPNARGDSRFTPCGYPVCGFTPLEAVAMTMNCERMVADPVDSPDYSTCARRRACSATAALAHGGGGRGLRCGGVAAGHEVGSALIGVEPDFGSEVKIEAGAGLSFNNAAAVLKTFHRRMLLWLNWNPVLSLPRHKS